jgi:type VI secretion system protein ImpA
MAEFDFKNLSEPLAEGDPCGPDLDLEGDREYMNFMAKIELLLPESYFAFDRTSIDFAAEFATLRELMQRTRDIRLLVVAAKLLILNKDVDGFASAVEAVDRLLKEQWEAVHPRGEDDGFAARMAILQTLDDMPSAVMPLQSVPLLTHRRTGPISFRSHALAAGALKPREDETFPDRVTIEQALGDLPMDDLILARNRSAAIVAALKGIRAASVERAGSEVAPAIDRLTALASNILAMLDKFVARRDPSAALSGPAATPDAPAENAGESGETTPVTAGAINSPLSARDALARAADYLQRNEPSNPALLLVRQAEQLIGKTFLDVLKVLIPQQLEQAAAQLGHERYFELPFGTLAGLVEASGGDSFSAGPSTTDGNGRAATEAAAAELPSVADRPGTIALLDQVAAFYRQFEPSSPIPLLIDSARRMMNKDFLSILKDILPPETLRGREL